ncbi:hypothetical protein [Taibaiella sp. KBW10]|uniref:hypothetical protein n=1 Tax=Taibaiella sp. KBW10 TaxID=2153357 RepID=UPI000F59F68C|nr:hypothetical protein [Taibaiella sp. KBW10]
MLQMFAGNLFAQEKSPYFQGKISYVLNYSDFQGNNINKKVAAFFDREQHLYINDQNYKILDQYNNHVKLYNALTNSYFYFNRDKTAYKIDVTSKTTQRIKVFEVEDVDTILGYACKAVKVEADFRAYIYFYSPLIKVDYHVYHNYNMEEWNAYLKASEGALPLKVITLDLRGKYVEDKEAVSVTPMLLAAADFSFPNDVKLRRLKYGLDLIW